MLILLLLSQIIFFGAINRATIMSPLFIIIFSTIILQFLMAPTLLLISSGQFNFQVYGEYQELFTILNIVLFTWFAGFTLFSNKSYFKFDNFSGNYKLLKKANTQFGAFCLLAGLLIYCLTYIYAGYSYIDALNNPLQFRFDLIGKTGGYYLRNFSLWLIYVSLAIFLIHHTQDIKTALKKKFIFIIFLVLIFILLIPLGSRSVLLSPLLLVGFILYNKQIFSKFHIFIGIILALLLISLLGIYRTIAYFQISDAQDLMLILNDLSVVEPLTILTEFSERFNNMEWFHLYLSEDQFFEESILVFNSIKELFILIIPPSFLGGIEKSYDVDTVLTIYFLGSQDFGTYGFTPMAEWSMNFGKKGYVLMPFISGGLMAIITNLSRTITNNMFALIFFSSFIFLDLIFLSIHSQGTANVVVFLCFNIALYLFYKIFFYPVNSIR